MISIRRARTSGQAMVFVGLLVGLGVLVGFVAIATDGGSSLLQRRNMQNGADAAALGAAQTLAASVVLSGEVPIYTSFNQDVTDRIDQTLDPNRGGTASGSSPSYSTTLEYGAYANSSYSYTVIATNSNGWWEYVPPYTAVSRVPTSADAVRVTTAIDNPTTFAQLIGVDSIHVEGVAAAALNDVPNYQAEGPTWPMTRCEIPDFDPQYGICNPFLFWSSNLNDPNCSSHGNFKNLAQLGEHQGASYEGAHEQLITGFDARPAMTEVTGVNNPCGYASGQWSPAGNCTDPTTYPPASYGDTCCSTNDLIADIDIANYLVNEFQGRIALTSTWPTSYFRPGYTPPPGDWLEAYNGGNLGQNISGYIRQVISDRGVTGGLSAAYGKYLDKVMYLYDISEVWTNDYPDCVAPCPYQWQPTGTNEAPNRVHISQALRFRFYEAMANTGGFDTPADVCGTSQHYNTSSSRVYGVFSGAVVDQPPCPNPPCGTPHGLNNYVGFIDP